MREKLMEQTIATNRAFKRLVEAEKKVTDMRVAINKAEGDVTQAKQAFAAEQAIHTKMIQESSTDDLESAWTHLMRNV